MSANRTEIVNEYSMMTSVYAFWYLQGDYIEYLDRGIFVTVFLRRLQGLHTIAINYKTIKQNNLAKLI